MNTLYLFANISGICLAFIRFTEPMVFQEFIHSCKKLTKPRETCCNYGKKKEETKMDMKSKLEQEKECKLKFSKESLCSFLNSSVNIEYVYLILTGIQKFMINSIENYESTNGTERQNSIVSKMSSARKMKAEKLIIKKNKNKTVIDMVGINIDNTED